jgi:hypothetical protein
LGNSRDACSLTLCTPLLPTVRGFFTPTTPPLRKRSGGYVSTCASWSLVVIPGFMFIGGGWVGCSNRRCCCQRIRIWIRVGIYPAIFHLRACPFGKMYCVRRISSVDIPPGWSALKVVILSSALYTTRRLNFSVDHPMDNEAGRVRT